MWKGGNERSGYHQLQEGADALSEPSGGKEKAEASEGLVSPVQLLS